MSEAKQETVPPFGACVFGTVEGLTIQGVGCLQPQIQGLDRALDLRTQKIERNEIAWFNLPMKSGNVDLRIVGRVGFTSDYKNRDGIVGVAMAVAEDAVGRAGYGSTVYTISRLYDWFVSTCIDAAGGIAFAKAGDVLAQLGVPATVTGRIGNQEPLRVKLPSCWKDFASVMELLRLLPQHKEFGDLLGRGFVLRESLTAKADHAVTEAFLEAQSKEREKHGIVIGQLYAAFDTEKRKAGDLNDKLTQLSTAVDSIKSERQQALVDKQTAESERKRVANELVGRIAELKKAEQAALALESQRQVLNQQVGALQQQMAAQQGALQQQFQQQAAAREQMLRAQYDGHYQSQLDELARSKAHLESELDKARAALLKLVPGTDPTEPTEPVYDPVPPTIPTEDRIPHLNPRPKPRGRGLPMLLLGLMLGGGTVYGLPSLLDIRGGREKPTLANSLAVETTVPLGRQYFKKDRERLSSQLRSLEQRHAALQSDERRTQARLTQAHEDLRLARSTSESLKRDSDSLQADVTRLKTENASLRNAAGIVPGPPPVAPPPPVVAPPPSQPLAVTAPACGLDQSQLGYLDRVKRECSGRPNASCRSSEFVDFIKGLKACDTARSCLVDKAVSTDNPFAKANVNAVEKVVQCIRAKPRS